MRILVVEDERPIANFIKKGLRAFHYTIDIAYNGTEGFYLAKVNPYDLFIFDLMVPGMDGIELTTEIRTNTQRNREKPIMILTAKEDTSAKVKALDRGADDYLTKPFAFAEFLARIRALTRRIPKPMLLKDNTLSYADVDMNIADHIVKRGPETLDLTRKEFGLLEYFMRNPEMVLSRTMILENVWDMNMDPFTNTVDVHVRMLRKKLQGPSRRGKLIHTVHGMGYRFAQE
jgi:two-component system OmpR family response regulator